jgi:hypothetical protein
MKNSKLIFFFIVVIVAGCKRSSEPGKINSFKRYPYERLHITYELGGDARGTEEVYISQYGKYEAQFSKSEVFSPQGIVSENHAIITRLSDAYTVDYDKHTYEHNHQKSFDSLYSLDEKDVPTPGQYFDWEMKSNLLRNTGTDTIAGKLASRWHSDDGNMTVWAWNGILMRKYIGTEERGIDMKIVSIDSLWNVDTTKFILPSGYTEKKKGQEMNAPEPD